MKPFKPVLLERYSWDESSHPRGQPENKGEFVEKKNIDSSKQQPELSEEERIAVREYANFWYTDINKDLKNDQLDRHTEPRVALLDAAIAKSATTKQLKLYRAVKDETLDDYEVGGQYSSPTYLSTAKEKLAAEEFAGLRSRNVILVMDIPKGCKALDFDDLEPGKKDAEREMLLPRNLSFDVTKKTRRAGKTYVYLKANVTE